MEEQDRITQLNADVDRLMTEDGSVHATHPEDAPLLELAHMLAKADLSGESQWLGVIRQRMVGMADDLEEEQTAKISIRSHKADKTLRLNYREHNERYEPMRKSSLVTTFSIAVVVLAVLAFIGLVFVLPRMKSSQASPPATEAMNTSVVTVSPQSSAAPIASPTPADPLMPDVPIYVDAIGEGWEDWSWEEGTITVDYANGDPVHSGSSSIAVTYTGGWSGLQIGYHGENLDASAYDTLRFWIHGGTTGGQTVVFSIGESVEQTITPQAGTWTQVDVPLLALGSPRTIYSMSWFNNTDGGQSVFFVDDITLVDTGVPAPTLPPPGPGPTLNVDAGAGTHPISPYIYGMNFADEDLAADINLPVRRWGGNSTTLYNWQIDVHNTGSDWYFENIPGDANNTETDQFVTQDQRTETKTILTIPLSGWTPKPGSQEHPFDCGFPVSVYGQQESTDEWDANCGNGKSPNGTPITGNDPSLTSIPVTTDFVTDWVDHLTGQFGTASEGGVMFYNLDNEPMLWNSTHRDVHPEPTSYDEMRDSTYTYAAALKAADPAAQTLGPVTWGWCAYFYSAVDDCGGNSTDFASHGNMHFTPWYLQQMQAYEQEHGVRILDYLDLHYYPQANGIYGEAGDETIQALRLRSTRALWDPTYADESWIADVQDGPYVRLIPRMREWVDANYPGTKLAITEYNWGALDHINGALAQADVLGIFGREGLDLATLWGPPESGEPGAYAFRMYLNYDGQEHTFGEMSVQAASTDQEKLAIYAATRQDGALTLMIINKTRQTLTSQVSLAGFSPTGSAEVYRYSVANVATIVREADQPVTSDGFEGLFPPESITLIVIPAE